MPGKDSTFIEDGKNNNHVNHQDAHCILALMSSWKTQNSEALDGTTL